MLKNHLMYLLNIFYCYFRRVFDKDYSFLESKEESLIYFILILFIFYLSSISRLCKRSLFKIFLFISI